MAKTNAVECLKNKEFTECSNFCEGDYLQKESRQRIVTSSACCSIYFRNRNRIVWSRFRLLCFCYGSNSGVGSYTSIISWAANQIPIVNACNSCLSEISASAFFKLFEQSLLLFCECGSEFRFKPHNGFEKFAFVCSVWNGVFVRINVAVIQIFKCVHGFHPFPSQTPYHSPCRKSSTFQNKNDFLQNRLFFRRKSDIIIRYIMSKEDLTMANGNATIIVGSARLGSAGA